MNIKTKISLGLLFLFALSLLVSGVAIYHLNHLADTSKTILKENNNSLAYTHAMLKSLDDLNVGRQRDALPPDWAARLDTFAQYLVLQENNLTEVGEPVLTAQIRADFEQLKKRLNHRPVQDTRPSVATLKNLLYQINDLNSQAILRKNQSLQATAQSAISLVAAIATACFMLSLSFLFSFPALVADPLSERNQRIREIAGLINEPAEAVKSNLKKLENELVSLHPEQKSLFAKLREDCRLLAATATQVANMV